MSEVSQILSAVGQGDAQAAERLLPLVYDELRRLAAEKMTKERPGQTLQATALVHEAYLRLVSGHEPGSLQWHSRGHFFMAAAEAMRRILIESARRKKTAKHGGDRQRVDLAQVDVASRSSPDELLLLDDALTRLTAEDASAADVARLRLFAGLSIEDAATALGISRATAFRHWTYARAWLQAHMDQSPTRQD